MKASKIISIGPLPDWVCSQFDAEYSIVGLGDSSRSDVLDSLDEEVVAIIARGSVLVDAEIFDKAPNLRVVSRTGVGYDSVVIEAATARGVPVVYTPGAMSRGVAEHAMALILGACRKLNEWRECLIRNDWEQRYRTQSIDLENSTLGIIGYGRIGKQLRHLIRPFDVRVLVDDPYIDHSAFSDHEVEFVTLEEVLELSDILTLHVPLNQETCGLINKSNISQVRKGTILVNTARGAVVESLDLLSENLESGRLGAVGLDVFPEEPPDTSHPIFSHPRAYLTGHVAARSGISQKRILETMLRETIAVLRGDEPDHQNIVNPEVFK